MKIFDGAISELDGIVFAQSLYSGCIWMMEREKQLDDINVFPVPDSDTGTNMSATMKMVKSNLEDLSELSISTVAENVAEASLMESRGNSGAILSQFFQGFSDAIAGKSTIDTLSFAKAVSDASHQAYQAVSNPKEGTILTVMREWSQYLVNTAPSIPYFSILIPRSLQFSQKILQNTKKQMEVLRKADVVDAGAQGFVYLLEGIVDYIQKGYTQRKVWMDAEIESVKTMEEQNKGKLYRFAMECLLQGTTLKHALIREELEAFAGSIVIAGSKQKIRIILQTDRPNHVVKALRKFGEVQQEKIDDLSQQNRDIYKENINSIAIVTDTSCDLPENVIEKYNIHKVPFRLHVNNESFLDELTITDDEFYGILLKTGSMAKTSQPSQADFSRIYDWTTKYFEKTLSIHLSRALSACEQAARQTALRYSSSSIEVIDSSNASVGLGLLVLYAARLIEKQVSWEELCMKVEAIKSKLHIYFMVNDINYLIKGGRLSAKQGMMAKLLNIKPILHLNDQGAIESFDKAIGVKLANHKMFSHIQSIVNSDKKYWISIAYTTQTVQAEVYKQKLLNSIKPDEIFTCQASPTIGSHTGPHVMGIAILELNADDIVLR
jgi:uncharacterized protein